MDSGNSGSMQSSGGDDDYDDSRAAADSSFIINTIYNPLTPPQPPTMFDSNNNVSNFLNPPISSSPQQFQHNQINSHFFRPQSLFPPPHFPTAPQSNETGGGGGGGVSASSSQPNDQDQTTRRNPKKRSRASRRAPTTILTTDTTNFRAMVQEFTGIPAPPFAPVPRSRLDLFSTPSSIRSNSYNSLFLRPLPQKLQLPPSYSNFLDDANNNNILSSQSPLVFRNSSELGLLKYPQRAGMTQIQNPSQSSSYNSSIFELSNTEHDFSLGMPSQTKLKNIGALEEFGLSYGQVNNAQVTGLADLVSPENCNNFSQNVTNAKQRNNYPCTNLCDEKAGTTDNVSISATRSTSEGMMEPWISSSD